MIILWTRSLRSRSEEMAVRRPCAREERAEEQDLYMYVLSYDTDAMTEK